jgi:hypothetical protein
MEFAEEHNLTQAGQAFLIGYLTRAAPRLAAQAIEHLKAMEADYSRHIGLHDPGYWIKSSDS